MFPFASLYTNEKPNYRLSNLLGNRQLRAALHNGFLVNENGLLAKVELRWLPLSILMGTVTARGWGEGFMKEKVIPHSDCFWFQQLARIRGKVRGFCEFMYPCWFYPKSTQEMELIWDLKPLASCDCMLTKIKIMLPWNWIIYFSNWISLFCEQPKGVTIWVSVLQSACLKCQAGSCVLFWTTII